MADGDGTFLDKEIGDLSVNDADETTCEWICSSLENRNNSGKFAKKIAFFFRNFSYFIVFQENVKYLLQILKTS